MSAHDQLGALFANVPAFGEEVVRRRGRIAEDAGEDTPENPVAGAVIPINQTGIKPGPAKLAQFLEAMRVGRVPTRATPILSATTDDGIPYHQFTHHSFGKKRTSLVQRIKDGTQWASFVTIEGTKLAPQEPVTVHDQTFDTEEQALGWLAQSIRLVGSKIDDNIAWVKLFDPDGAGTWFITDWQPEDKTAFGWCHLLGRDCAEFGYLSLEELATVKGRLGIGIEIDNWFQPMPVGEAKRRFYGD